MDFFDYSMVRPQDLNELCSDINKLTDAQFNSIREIVGELARLNGR